MTDDGAPTQRAGPTAPHRSNRGQCAHLLRGPHATVGLPRHCPLFALQLLDLTNRWWSESEGPDIEEGIFYSPAAAAYVGIELTPPSTLTQLHSSFQTLDSRPCANLAKRATSVHMDTMNYELADLHAGRLGASLRDPLFLEW